MNQEKNGRPQRLAATSGFFQDISIEFLIHELKDPIAVIETGLRTVLEKQDLFGPLTGKQANTLMRSLRNARKAWGLLNDLLEVGRCEAGCLSCSRYHAFKALYQALKEALETVTGPASEEIGRYQNEAELIKLLNSHDIFVHLSPGAAAAEMFQDETKFRQIAGNLFKKFERLFKRRDAPFGVISNPAGEMRVLNEIDADVKLLLSTVAKVF